MAGQRLGWCLWNSCCSTPSLLSAKLSETLPALSFLPEDGLQGAVCCQVSVAQSVCILLHSRSSRRFHLSFHSKVMIPPPASTLTLVLTQPVDLISGKGPVSLGPGQFSSSPSGAPQPRKATSWEGGRWSSPTLSVLSGGVALGERCVLVEP